MTTPPPDPPELEELLQVAAWRMRLHDADPNDDVSLVAAQRLQVLASELGRDENAALRTELRSICNWLAESDAISDYAELAGAYRARIGVSDHPVDAAAYLRGLLVIAHGLL